MEFGYHNTCFGGIKTKKICFIPTSYEKPFFSEKKKTLKPITLVSNTWNSYGQCYQYNDVYNNFSPICPS